MKFIIIGLGNFGLMLAEELISVNCEVIAVDNNPARVELVKERIPSVFQLDATDPFALKILPLKEVDSVVVAIGEDFGSSVKTVAALKSLGVKHIQARAIDDIHENVLQGFSISRILKPERESSRAYVQSVLSGNSVEGMAIDDAHSIVKISVPGKFDNTVLGEFELEELRLHPFKVCRVVETSNVLGFKSQKVEVLSTFDDLTPLRKGDVIFVYGANADFHPLWKLLK